MAPDYTKTISEDTILNDAVVASSPNGYSLTYSLVTGPTHGNAVVNPDGTYAYTPHTNYNGDDSFHYMVDDGNGGIDTGTVTITINAVNDPPVNTVPGPQTIQQNTPLVFSAGNGNPISVYDLEATQLLVTLQATNGVLDLGPHTGLTFFQGDGTSDSLMTFQGTIANINTALNGMIFMPTLNYLGPDGLLQITTNDLGQSGISPVILTDTDIVGITVVPADGNPVARNDGSAANPIIITPGATNVQINVLSNDWDPHGTPLTITTTTNGVKGTVTTDGTYVYYSHNIAAGLGQDLFNYIITDVLGGTATATVFIGINIAPVAADDSANTKQEVSVTIPVLNNDSDLYLGTLSVASVTQPTHGTVVINGDNTVTYTPNQNYYGLDSFTYTVSDGYGGTATARVSVTVNRNVCSVFVHTTASNNNPTVGETITITFKLGNNGPDEAKNVVFTYTIPEGMEFIGIKTESGYPEATYDAATKTITWNLGTVPILDPWFELSVRNLISGVFIIDPSVSSLTYDPNRPENIQSIIINAATAINTHVNAATTSTSGSTVGMQNTGIPMAGIVLAILMVVGGFIGTQKKQ